MPPPAATRRSTQRIHALRGQAGQQLVARCYAELLAGSEIRRSHLENDPRVQDPYSLRCQPQVMGACLDQMRYAARVFELEAAAVTDNPLVFHENDEILSGGNFHAEPIALAADALALAIAEIGALSERRIALLIDTHAFRPAAVPGRARRRQFRLHGGAGDRGGAREREQVARAPGQRGQPADLGEPGGPRQHGDLRGAPALGDMAANSAGIVAIELLAAAQGIDFRAPLKTSPRLQEAHALVRSRVGFYDHDRYFAPDITAIQALVESGAFHSFAPGLLFSV